MPYWVVASKEGKQRALMGPYLSYSQAVDIKDNLEDGHSEVYETVSMDRRKAGQELREKRVREIGLDEGFKNFSHK